MAIKNLSLDWKQWYQDHLTTTEQAAKFIKNGDCFWLGVASQIPYELLEVLDEKKEDYNDVTLLWNVMNQPNSLIFDSEAKNHFKMMSSYNLPIERMALSLDCIECGGVSYDYFPYWPKQYNCNGFAIHICPPDENGYCNCGHYGVALNTVLTQADYMKKKIAFIDKTGQWPVPGDVGITSIHVSEFDIIVEADTNLVEVPTQPPTSKDAEIASYILPYLKENDNIQIGFGGLGEEVLAHLKTVGKMNVYSEVFCDNMADLCQEGVLQQISAASPGAVTTRFLDFMTKDQRVSILPQPETIDPIGTLMVDNLVAINATFMCDLLGQCCSEAQGLTPYSGPGGSFAYIYGATRSKGGRSFLCLRSTYNDHEGIEHSNIVPWLPEGSIVTTPKVFVMYLVTEYGVADVFLKSIPDRIRAIIKIAKPEYRQELKEKILTTPLISDFYFKDFNLYD